MKRILLCALILGCGTVACRSPEQKVQDEKVEAAREIGKAEQKAAKTEADAQHNVAVAAPDKKDEAKIDATEKIADAEKKVDDEKVEATKEISKAEQDAGHGGSYKKE
ncbi:MAG: hypothetical protein U0136_15815 [Bdellovibrionota bacterium]